MPAAVKPAERVSLTYDERNGNYNSNKTPFLKIVLPKMEIFTAQCVGRCAGKWTPFGGGRSVRTWARRQQSGNVCEDGQGLDTSPRRSRFCRFIGELPHA